MTLLSSIPKFNPRTVPVVGVDSHLPALPLERMSAHALRECFARSDAFVPDLQIEPPLVDKPLRDAAVLIPIVQRHQPMVLLTQRTAEMKNHPGQIAFAGGKVDNSDASHADAALREAWEEVGLERRFVQAIGELPPYVTGTAFRITPVVALVDAAHQIRINQAEVAASFEVPLAFLMNPANHQRHRVVWDFGKGPVAREWFSMPYLQAHRGETDEVERFIWGATAGILRNLYQKLMQN